MILYHSYSKVSEVDEAQKKLDEFKQELLETAPIKIETMLHMADDFMEELERVARHRKVELIIMGITERSVLAQVFIGSKTLKMAQTKVCPVLIVPEKAQYKDVKNAMMASDFKDTVNTTPSMPIKDFLSIFKPNLHIVNVDPEHYIAITEEYDNEKKKLAAMFSEFDPEFYFLRLYDIDEALNLFAETKDIDLIIAIQRNHSFMEKLFKRSRTKQLSYQSKVPVLIVHE
jgi:nucleotide-binding universal stress UspA family protein